VQAKARAAAEAAARRAAAGLPPAAPLPAGGGGAPTRPRGSPLDAVAVLTAAGAAAIAGGRGLSALAGPPPETLDGEADAGSAAAAAEAEANARADAVAAAAAGISAAADVAAALPLPSAVRESLFQRREDFVRLHAIKRRLWEQHNMVLGRQESFSLRTQKRSLNLSTSGLTTADDIRASGRDGQSSGSYAAVGDRRPEAVSVAGEAEAAGGGGGSGDGGGGGGGPSLWASRATVDRGLDLVLALQDSARVLLGMLRAAEESRSAGGARGPPPPPPALLAAKREEVAALRGALAAAMGCGEGSGVPLAAAAAALPPLDSPADAALLALLSLPKGKKLLVRAVPMLSPAAKATLCGCGLRRLPHFVASNASGREAEEADAAAAAALADWVGGGPGGAVGGARGEGAPGEALAALAGWGGVLFDCHAGATLRALLGHPGASAVISALLTHGEAQREAAEGALTEGRLSVEALAATEAAVGKWKDVTDKLGRAYMESETS
jgi:hypothetical protein